MKATVIQPWVRLRRKTPVTFASDVRHPACSLCHRSRAFISACFDQRHLDISIFRSSPRNDRPGATRAAHNEIEVKQCPHCSSPEPIRFLGYRRISRGSRCQRHRDAPASGDRVLEVRGRETAAPYRSYGRALDFRVADLTAREVAGELCLNPALMKSRQPLTAYDCDFRDYTYFARG